MEIFIVRILIILFYSTFIAHSKLLYDDENVAERRLKLARPRRQLLSADADLENHRHLDLNQSVPFIFSARLYPFGAKNGDTEMVGDVTEMNLPRPLIFLENAYDTIWIHRNGLVSMAPNFESSASPKQFPLPSGPPLIAAFWTNKSSANLQRRRVLIRETNDEGTLALAQSEVNIQFRYGPDFAPETFVLITWIDSKGTDDEPEEADLLVQLALILGKNACFAHMIFSKVPERTQAISGFNGAQIPSPNSENANPKYFLLPDTGSAESEQLTEKSNIGIPGEWLMRIDENQIHLCGAGFQGLECVDSCLPTQWYLDCSRPCHCADGTACNIETGECPDGKCSPGWKGGPICDEDINECMDETITCPDEQPDCMNTPGAYLCLCFEYDNSTGACIGSSDELSSSENTAKSDRFAVPISSLSVIPKIGPILASKISSTKLKSKILSKSSPVELMTTLSSVTPKLLVLPKSTTTTRKPPILLPADFRRSSSLSHGPDHHHHSPSAMVPPLQHSADSEDTVVSSSSNSAETAVACTDCDRNARCARDGKCECQIGWSGDGKKCFDIDECTLNSTICGINAECQNIIGSYQCVCNAGFIASQNGDGCIDVDECEEAASSTTSSSLLDICPQANSVCKNAIGGFVCECKSGFIGNPAAATGCADVDECQLAEYYCGINANCTNLPGSFRCDCHPGFELAPNTNHCQDIDECAAKTKCHKAATCTNLEGGFHCECIEGFVGNGIDCHETILFSVDSKHSDLFEGIKMNTTVHLETPIRMFGQKYSDIYISRNGILSFDRPINDSAAIEDVFEMQQAALLPLYSKYEANIGSVDVQQIEEISPIHKGLFTRASMLIKQYFHMANFRSQRILIITWRDMKEAGNKNTNNSSTFQAVLIIGNSATFAIFLYENVHISAGKLRHFAGILHPSDGLISAIPAELLSTRSNIGQPGKWLFRVDDQKIYTCPSGTQGPPFCQEDCDPGTFGLDCSRKCRCANGMPCDFANGNCTAGKCAAGFTGSSCDEDVDECQLGTHRCHANATCTNLIGSYSCECQPKFHGDGFNCSQLDICLIRSNMKCADNAHCDSSNEELPECVCNDGFNGDGRRNCLPNEPTSPTISSTLIKTIQTMTTFTTILRTESETVTPTTTFIPRRRPAPYQDDDRNLTNIGQQNNEEHSGEEELITAANESKWFMLVVCLVIGAIWLIIVLSFALLYCIKRYRRIRHSEYSPQMLSWIQTRTLARNGPASNYQYSTTKFF